MAVIYVKSTTGSNANNGTTWALAKATIAGAFAIAAAGDTIYVSHVHAETTAVGVTWTSPGTQALGPCYLYCVNDGAEPPTTPATSASAAVTGNNVLAITGALKTRGFTFNVGTGASSTACDINIATSSQGTFMSFEDCKFQTASNSAGANINIGASSASDAVEVHFINCTWKPGHTGQVINVVNAAFRWIQGGLESGSSAITALIAVAQGRGTTFFGEDLDLSLMSSTANMVNGWYLNCQGYLRNCKMHASWTSATDLMTGQFNSQSTFAAYNCIGADIHLNTYLQTGLGKLVTDTAVRVTGTDYSWKMTSAATAVYPLYGLKSSIEFSEVITTAMVGNSKTYTVPILFNGASKLTDAQVYFEGSYPGTSGFPMGVRITDAKANFLTAATDQGTNSVDWTGGATSRANSTGYVIGDTIKVSSNTGRLFFCVSIGTSAASLPGGYATAVDGDSVADGTTSFRAGWRQEVAVTFTPLEVGRLNGWIFLPLASTTIWVSPYSTTFT